MAIIRIIYDPPQNIKDGSRCTSNLHFGLKTTKNRYLPKRGKCLAPQNAVKVNWEGGKDTAGVISGVGIGGLCVWYLPYLALNRQVERIPLISIRTPKRSPITTAILVFLRNVFPDDMFIDYAAGVPIEIPMNYHARTNETTT